jgi:hypothetical protein
VIDPHQQDQTVEPVEEVKHLINFYRNSQRGVA